MSLHGCVPKDWVRNGQIAALLVCFLICVGCGDVYRPTIIPNPVPIPPPQNFHTAFAVNQNGTVYPGTGMQVDVSGDTNAGVTKVAMNPVHATVLRSSVWVANYGSDSVSVFSEAQSAGGIGTATDINLIHSQGSLSKPVFVASTETGTMYVANSGQLIDANTNQPYYAVDAILNAGSPSSAVIDEIRLPGAITPWAMTETPDHKKLYVVNRDSNNVSVVNTVDRTINTTLSAGVGISPRWAVARSDSTRVYVLANDGTLTTIDTTQPTDHVLSTISVGAGSDSFYYDSRLNRLYIPNPTTSSVSIYDVTADPPSILATIDLTKPITAGGTDSPCPQSGCFPLSVAALPDGSRTYIASYFIDSTSPNCAPTACVQAQLTVLNTLNNQVIKAIALPQVTVSSVGNCGVLPIRFRVSAAASADSSRVYISSCDGGGVASVRTSDNTYVVTLSAPVSAYTPPAVNITAAVQNGLSTTYSYTQISGVPLFLGMPVSVTGIANSGDTTLNPDNGTFKVTGLGAGTFTVINPLGVSTTSTQTAVGLGQPPPQNPAFMLAGP
jgi:YVTN family beta-propeller protein